MENMRLKSGDDSTKKARPAKKRVSKRNPLGPAFRSARVRKSESRTSDTGDPSVP